MGPAKMAKGVDSCKEVLIIIIALACSTIIHVPYYGAFGDAPPVSKFLQHPETMQEAL